MTKRVSYLILAILFVSPCFLLADREGYRHTSKSRAMYGAWAMPGGKEDAQAGSIQIAVISDVHIMEPSLLVNDGTAFENYVRRDRKMLKEGPDILNKVIERLLEARPQVVLVTGDLTKDGECVSHHYLADHFLSRLKAAGIRTLVIPGNHDVNNPRAVAYDGNDTHRVPTVSAAEFAACYADYGYGNAIARDSFSLSYVSQLSPSLRILAIDACRYEDNNYKKNVCVTAGRIKPETLAFIRAQANDARRKGIRMVAMMHHGLVQHWTWQDKAMKEYLVEDWKEMAKEFAQLGIETVFTGHFHAHDIASYQKGRNSVYDIETGSTLSYPSPYRLVSLSDKGMAITTCRIDSLNGQSLASYSKRYALEGISTILSGMLPASIPEEIRKEACDVFGQAYVRHLAGDEKLDNGLKDSIEHAARQLRPYSQKYAFLLKHLAHNLSTDLYPEDNNIFIYFQNKN